MDKIAIEIGKIIANLRSEKGLSQNALADLAGVHRTYISQIERGLKYPTIYVLVQIANALDIKLSLIIIELENKIK